ncbi:MAG: D-alanine--poly(phosphoribitol) ligase subunit DltA [Anaerovoracaceae bacterium]
MNLLNKVAEYAQKNGKQVAVRLGTNMLTYSQLEEYSGKLASWIQKTCGNNKKPVVVYGHKDVYMLVCFLAAVKSGRGYCPIDISIPENRVKDIINTAEASMIFALEDLSIENERFVDSTQIKEAINQTDKVISQKHYIDVDDVFYIIFTSGSTGAPKGVQITAECLYNYLDWSVDLGTNKEDKFGKGFLNQAPFSFDLSVMDIYTCFATCGTLNLLAKDTQMDFKQLLPALKESQVSTWVSTPSFADMCMADKQFSQELMPELNTFLFCGETLTNSTALKLMDRFPKASIINTYGPTESTVAVTDIKVTRAIAEDNQPIPVGSPKPGTIIEIRRPDGALAQTGESGEIVICGNTVSIGYFHNKEQTEKAFIPYVGKDKSWRAYKTGDKGRLDEEGNLHYEGRMDLQIKLNGYRIELEDIEKNLMKNKEVSHAVVIPKIKEGKVRSLTAFVTGIRAEENNLKTSKKMKGELKEFLPAYMIPKKIVFIDKLPMNQNGKVDRKRLGELA